MAKLISMKLPKPKKEDLKAQDVGISSTSEEYPYGLRLLFDDERIIEKLPVLKKLDIDEAVKITARACVTSIDLDKRQGKDGTTERLAVTIQIEEIAIERTNADEDAFDEAAGKKG